MMMVINSFLFKSYQDKFRGESGKELLKPIYLKNVWTFSFKTQNFGQRTFGRFSEQISDDFLSPWKYFYAFSLFVEELTTDNIGPQCVQNRRSVGSSRKESKPDVRDCTFDNI